jgi:hypothetical protein
MRQATALIRYNATKGGEMQAPAMGHHSRGVDHVDCGLEAFDVTERGDG